MNNVELYMIKKIVTFKVDEYVYKNLFSFTFIRGR